MKNYKLAPMIGGFVLVAFLNTAGIFFSEIAQAAPDGKSAAVDKAKTTDHQNNTQNKALSSIEKKVKTDSSVKNSSNSVKSPSSDQGTIGEKNIKIDNKSSTGAITMEISPNATPRKTFLKEEQPLKDLKPAVGADKSVPLEKSVKAVEPSLNSVKREESKSKSDFNVNLESVLKSESQSSEATEQTAAKNPVAGAVEESMRDWEKTADWAKSFRSKELGHTVARIEGASDSSKVSGTVPALPSTGSLSSRSSVPAKTAPAPAKAQKSENSLPDVLPVPANVPNRDVRKSFINESPNSLESVHGNSLSSRSSLPSGSSYSAGNSASSPSLGGAVPRGSFSGDSSQQALTAVDYSGENIPAVKGTDIRIEAYVEIPKGEGYEALISANGQGLLVELGLAELDAQGKPVFLPDGKQKRRNLKKGMTVKKGDDLGKQNDREQAANKIVAEEQLVVAKKEAEKILEIEVAELAATVAQSEYYRAQDANRKMPGAVTPEEVVQRAYEWKRADKSAEKAKYDLEVKQDEVKVRKAQVTAADAQVLDRKLISPINGIIDDVMQNEGQWMREGDNILKIIRLDKVQISGKVDARYYSPKMVDGKDVTVYVQQPGTKLREMKGKVSYARQIVESGWYYIYAEVENVNESGYWVLMPGTLVTMDIHR